MFMIYSAKSRKLIYSEDDSHPSLYSFTINDWSLRLLEKTWQQFLSNKFISSCVICLVIAREIFLLQSDSTAISKLHNFSLLSFIINLFCKG